MIYHRIFPRYSTNKVNAKVKLVAPQSDVKLEVENISLGGIQLRAHVDFNFQKSAKISINFLNRETYILDTHLVWSKFNKEEKRKMYGFELRFNSVEDFQKWLILIRAFHLLKRKKAYADS